MKLNPIQTHVESQFSPHAASYAVSAVHADADALQKLVDLVQPNSTDEVLDVATGAGHTALAFAPHVKRVVAYDLTQSMLDQTLSSAKERRLQNVEGVLGKAEELTFPDNSFDLYTVRLAPHHFADLQASIMEAHRVLRPGGRYLAIDSSAPEEEDVERQIHEIEVLRDPSHVHNYRLSEWTQMLQGAGFEIDFAEYGYMAELDLGDWTTRMRTPELNQIELRRRFITASPALKEALKIRFHDDSIAFTLPRVTILARKAA